MAVGTTAFPTSLDTVVELVEITNNAIQIYKFIFTKLIVNITN
jgi:hypothetical protein